MLLVILRDPLQYMAPIPMNKLLAMLDIFQSLRTHDRGFSHHRRPPAGTFAPYAALRASENTRPRSVPCCGRETPPQQKNG